TDTRKPPIVPITLRRILYCLLALTAAIGCKQSTSDQVTPTEPWLRDEVDERSNSAPMYSRYRVRPGSSLAFSLPTRTHKPTGQLYGIEGYVDVDLRDLAKSRGLVTIDLRKLTMEG